MTSKTATRPASARYCGVAATWSALALTAVLGDASDPAQAADAGAAAKSGIPPYAHIFVIVAENKGYDLIIGPQSAAPNINDLAQHYGLATHFFAEVHPSEGNYIAMLGGDTFGIHDDDAFYCKPGMSDRWCSSSHQTGYVDHTVRTRSLMDQLESHHLSWKGYMQSLPAPGSLVIRWPEQDEPVPGLPTQLYAAKHNGFISFERVQHDAERSSKIVGFDVLDRDIASGQLPNYAHIVPNQCDDMHGRDQGKNVPADCLKSSGAGLIARGDRVIGDIVRRLMASAAWGARQNSAIVITFDEDDKDERQGAAQGCCGNEPGSAANSGGGRIPTIVITNHGPRGIVDDTPYNHYSLLRTTEAAFGIDEYLNHASEDGKGVVTMTALFAGAH